ncbi:hypothetical protein H6P81_013959 [Aristolochia fimbriata]|uniref:non-specific serine/threonine protein kinase n=1 Tax=Aristolochia fimbriata TaxID=158543 RepID=A0AAV7EHC9_ARIFI|nr:hypothetical protein H6P81_013959 [Aristolochia fimbriata]
MSNSKSSAKFPPPTPSSPPLLLRVLFVVFFLMPFTSSVFFRIPSFDKGATNILYEGDAQVSNGAIQMNDYEYLCRVGRASYYRHVPIWDNATQRLTDFTTRFSFSIDTRGKQRYGHGLVFYIAPANFPIPANSNGGFLGLFNTTTLATPSSNQIVAVEFDSSVDGGQDWDPPYEHVGICVNHLRPVAYVPWNASLHSEARASAWVDYSSKTKRLSVLLTYEENPIFPGKYNLSYEVDLRRVLPEWVSIGFVAATGMNMEANTVYSWEFNSSLEMEERIAPTAVAEKNDAANKWIAAFAASWGAFVCWSIIACVILWRRKVRSKKKKKAKAEWEQCVVHRDIKSSNVMLDSGFNAKLGDFGLAKLMDHDLGPRTTGLAGTWGYLAPEYISRGKASKESDVYSFGVVVLEIACGRKAVEHEEDISTMRLVEWVWGLHGNGRLLEAVDRRLGDVDFDVKQMERLMIVGLWCAHPDHSLRPSIRQAIQVLGFEAEPPQLPPSMPVATYRSAITDSESQSSHGSITYTSLPVGR